MQLEILFPTYNRCDYLLKNLQKFDSYIKKNNLKEKVGIIVSNNASTDNTYEDVNDFSNNSYCQVKLFSHEHNLGLEKNALFILGQATAPYVMFMGDDDYIQEDYLLSCLKVIDSDSQLGCIIGCVEMIDEKGNYIGHGRDYGEPSRKWEPGFRALKENAHKLHQLSGLVLRRECLYDEYVKRDVSNIYPFTFWGGYCMQRYNTVQITDYPISVTHTQKKDWAYGKDGLLQDYYKNYARLDLSHWQRYLLESKMVYLQPFRVTRYGIKKMFRTIWLVCEGANTSFWGHLLLPFSIFAVLFKSRIKSLTQLFYK